MKFEVIQGQSKTGQFIVRGRRIGPYILATIKLNVIIHVLWRRNRPSVTVRAVTYICGIYNNDIN